MSSFYLRCGLCFSIILQFSCSDSVQQLARTQPSVRSEHAVLDLLAGGMERSGLNLTSPCALESFYQARRHNPVWIRNEHLTPLADTLLYTLRHAQYYGLISDEYHLPAIDSLLLLFERQRYDEKLLASLDILMSDALITMAHHLRFGRVRPADSGWAVSTIDADEHVMQVLDQAILKSNLRGGLAALEPTHESYHALKRELRVKSAMLTTVADDSLVNIVKQQMDELMLNMEQWRWETFDLAQRHIMVNIPSFRLAVVDRDTVLFESRVVVGTPDTPTPTLDSDINGFVLFPFWNVPRDIATEELLPKIKRDTSYLQAHRYRVLDIAGNEVNPDSVDWSQYHVNNFPFMLQQAEGESNALGIIKFPFLSERPIYLHDTNAPRFFKRDQRAYSHGCVRVERAIDLARFLAGDEYKTKLIDRYLDAREQRFIRVDPIDIHIRYYTCEVHPDGSVTFHQDVYGRNKSLYDAIHCRLKEDTLAVDLVEDAGQSYACL